MNADLYMRIGEMRAELVQQTSEMDKMVMNSILKNLQDSTL